MRKWTWYRWVLVVLFAFMVALSLLNWLSKPVSTHEQISITTESPTLAPAEGMLVRRLADKGKITRVHHKIHLTRLSSRATGSCYRVDARVIGDNPLIDDIVTGTGHFHWCVNRLHPNRILDKYTYANKDHSESWGWELNNIELTSGMGWSTKWCLDPGEQGPCAAVQYRYWRFTFRWDRGISVFGQEIKMHKTLYTACTVRGNPGGFVCGTGEV